MHCVVLILINDLRCVAEKARRSRIRHLSAKALSFDTARFLILAHTIHGPTSEIFGMRMCYSTTVLWVEDLIDASEEPSPSSTWPPPAFVRSYKPLEYHLYPPLLVINARGTGDNAFSRRTYADGMGIHKSSGNFVRLFEWWNLQVDVIIKGWIKNVARKRT